MELMLPRTQLAFLVMTGWTGQRFPSRVPRLRGGYHHDSLIVALERLLLSSAVCGSALSVAFAPACTLTGRGRDCANLETAMAFL